MFEELLALNLRFPVIVVQKFEQPQEYGMCSTLVIRWIKYKLVSNKGFWDKLVIERAAAKGHDQRDAKDIVSRKRGDIQRQQFHYESVMVKAGRRGVSSEAMGGEVHGRFAVLTLTGHIAKEGKAYPKHTKLFSKFSGQDFTDVSRRPFTAQSPQAIASDLTREGWASYIFLSTSQETSSAAHVLGAFCSGAKVSFFDPNMGEVALAKADFATWFGLYKKHWPANYKQLDHYYVAHVRGIPV